jgi:hypothetical protein
MLVDLGVPIVAGKLNRAGDPDGMRDPRWKSWERTRPNTRPIDRWARGEALGALTGYAFDVLDVDPRNGGLLSMKQMAADLGDDGPEEFWRIRTASGGKHIYISPLGLGGHNSFMPGLDLKSKGGFCFIPPTIRPSKDPGNANQPVQYVALSPLVPPPSVDETGGALRDYITEKLAAKRGARGSGKGREALSDLEQACLDAERGEQHEALRRLVDELARTSDDNEYVLYRAWKIAQQMTAFVKSSPWTENDVRGLLHKPNRRPIADATEAEKDMLDGAQPIVRQLASGLKPMSAVASALTTWLWLRYLAFGDATIVDADAGMGKSNVSLDLVARATRGWPMPGETESLSGPVNCLILAPEDREEVIKARLMAAGADLERVFIPEIEIKKKPGQKERAYLGGHMITFPENVEQFHKWIKAYDIGFVVIDPIAAFLGEKVDAHKDSSVRKALEPFVIVLGQEKATAWLIRHLNKDTKQSVAFRGGGSVAFGAVARTHLFIGELPEATKGDGTHALATIKSNNLKRRKGVALSYTLEDSDIRADDDGNFVPKVTWFGEVQIDLETLASGGNSGKGPTAWSQPKIRMILEELFESKDDLPAKVVLDRLAQDGFTDHKTVDKVTAAMGVRKYRKAKRGALGGTREWRWTLRTERVSGEDEA